MIRTTTPDLVELAVIDKILGGASYDDLTQYGPVGRTLSRLIGRPTTPISGPIAAALKG